MYLPSKVASFEQQLVLIVLSLFILDLECMFYIKFTSILSIIHPINGKCPIKVAIIEIG